LILIVFFILFQFRKRIISIEDLSNEIFYDIFDYFDGCQLYESFSNLNTHFTNLLIHPSLLLKINLCSYQPLIFEQTCMNLINPNKSQIISLRLSNPSVIEPFMKSLMISSLFSRLQSLAINGIVAYKLQLFLLQLASLSRLHSLTICLTGRFKFFHPIFELIFHLPSLKYHKLSYGPWRVPVTLSLAMNEKFSLIEHLNINIDITVDELAIILSYTPQLRRLICSHLLNSDLYVRIDESSILCNLTHIYIHKCRLQFNVFEMFIKKICSQLQVLRLATSEDVAFLDADRWENLIVQYIPNLRKFEFEYEEKIPNSFQLQLHHQQINRFLSSFWVERQWYFELETNASPLINERIRCLIRSYRYIEKNILFIHQFVFFVQGEMVPFERTYGKWYTG
jgi:hypothetical protein